MPHTTHAYPFEAKVYQFAEELSVRFTSRGSLRSFLLLLAADGNATSLTFEDDSPDWQERVQALEYSKGPYLFYDPLDDGMEYVWLSWQGIKRSVMERLIGQRLEEADFLAMPIFARRAGRLAQEQQFPETWGVMF